MPASSSKLQEIFAGCTVRPLLLSEPLERHTSFRIGGPADLLAQPTTEAELSLLLQRAKKHAVAVTLIGNGTNLLVRDKGIRGLVIKLGSALTQHSVDLDRAQICAGSGLPLALTARKAREHSLSGFEFAAGIPGSLGGAVYMNAGAYGGEMSQIVRLVRVMDYNGECEEIAAENLAFRYRHTALMERKAIITAVVLQLKKGDKEQIAAKMADLNLRRAAKQPLEFASAGSIFKRPANAFAAALIEEAGLKGFTIGRAQVSRKHSGFIINLGGARAADVLELINYVQARVFATQGVQLEPEVIVVGEE